MPNSDSKVVDSYGWESQAEPCSQEYIEPALISTLEKLGARKVLDLGCGNGAMTKRLTTAGFDTSGCDADADGIALAQKSGGNFFVASVYDEPEIPGKGKYDAVVSTEVVEHLFSPQYLPMFASSVIKPGGYLVVTTPYHGYIKNLVLSVLNKWDTHADPLWEGGHIKFFSRQTLTRLLEENGFRVVDFQGLGRFPFLWKSMLLVARAK